MEQKKNHSPAAFPGREITKQRMKSPDCITLHHTYRPWGAAGMAGGKVRYKRPDTLHKRAAACMIPTGIDYSLRHFS